MSFIDDCLEQEEDVNLLFHPRWRPLISSLRVFTFWVVEVGRFCPGRTIPGYIQLVGLGLDQIEKEFAAPLGYRRKLGTTL